MTSVIRWNPMRELAAMQSAMDRIFDEAWREGRPGFMGSNNLPIDVHETDNAYTIVANIPGVNPDHININVHDGTLSISIDIAQPEVAEGTRVIMQERFFGNLTRRFNLPQTVNVENVDASYEAGVLTLTLPKVAEAQPRQIRVKALNANNN